MIYFVYEFSFDGRKWRESLIEVTRDIEGTLGWLSITGNLNSIYRFHNCDGILIMESKHIGE